MTAKGLRRSLDSIDNEWSASADDAPDATSAEQGAAPPHADWKVNVEGGEIVSMSAAEIVAKLRAGELSRQSLAWRDGMEDWTALEALPSFQLAAPVSSQPAASESRPKVSEDVTVSRAPQRTEVGLQPPSPTVVAEAGSAAYEPYETEDATSVRVLPDVPLDEATVIIHEPETIPPPPLGPDEVGPASARAEDLTGALAVYERPVATLAFPEMDAPTDEETVISEPPQSTEPPPPAPPSAKSAPPAKSSLGAKTEDPPVPPLPKLPSRALVSTAAAAFIPPSQASRSPSGAPRLSSLGPATGSRPSSPSSPSITKKPLVPSAPPAASSRPAPLVEALLSLTDKTSAPATATPAPATPAPATPTAKSSTPAPAAPSAKVTSTPPVAPSAKAPSAPPVRVKPETPVVTVEQPAPQPPVSRFSRQHTPAETPRARSERPASVETPTPSVAAAPVAPAVAPPVAPEIPLPADSDPLNEAPPPPPLPGRAPAGLAALAANTTPTIILREDRDADTQITNMRLGRSVPLRTAVAAGTVSTVLGSLITGLVVSALSAEPQKPAPLPAAVVTVTAAPPPAPAPAPEPPKPAVEEAAAPKPSAAEPSIPSVSARELAAEKVAKKPKRTWTAPKPKPAIADPEVALPEDPPSAEAAPAEKKPSPASDTSDSASDKNKAAWETSPSPGF